MNWSIIFVTTHHDHPGTMHRACDRRVCLNPVVPKASSGKKQTATKTKTTRKRKGANSGGYKPIRAVFDAGVAFEYPTFCALCEEVEDARCVISCDMKLMVCTVCPCLFCVQSVLWITSTIESCTTSA